MSSPTIKSTASNSGIPPSPLTSALQSSNAMELNVDDEENDKRVTVDEHFDVDAHQNTDNNNDDNNEGKSSTFSSSSSIDESKSNTSTKNELQIRSDFSDVRIAVIGNVDAGKSSLIGVLTSGALDDGRGLARSKIFIHHHESTTGRTSCISHHILGFNDQHEPVHQTAPASASAAQKSKSWHAVVSNSKNIVTFVDLCGHEKYLKTTIAGLTGSFPDFAMVLVNSLAGITKMTREHLGISIALEIPLIIVVTKIDLAPPNVLETTKAQLDKILKSNAAKKMPVTVRNNADIDVCIENQSGTRIAPIFYISSVEGTGLNLLYSYISRLKPRFNWIKDLGKPSEFDIDETFQVAGVGIVVSGTVKAGVIKSGDEMLLGPISSENGSEWMPVLVRSVHCKRVPVENVNAGNSCALSIRSIRRKDALKRQTIRRGMVLVDGKTTPKATRFFEAEILVLNHPTTVKFGYQAVIHAGIIRQTASMIHIDKEYLRSGDRATVRFKFIQHEEFLHPETVFVFREGSTKGLGKVTKTSFTEKEIEAMEADDLQQKQKQKQKHQDNTASVTLSEAEADAARIAAGPSSAEEAELEERLRAAVGQIIQPTNTTTGVIDDKRLKQKYNTTKKHHDETEQKSKKAADKESEANVDKGGAGKHRHDDKGHHHKKEQTKDSDSSSSAAAKGKKSKR